MVLLAVLLPFCAPPLSLLSLLSVLHMPVSDRAIFTLITHLLHKELKKKMTHMAKIKLKGWRPRDKVAVGQVE